MIYFVGAGTGAEDLITVRGMRLLQQAQIIIYTGSLVNPKLLDYAKPSCVIYNSATMTLDEVLAVMEQHHEQTIVRLHTGEPSLYGAIREQMDHLDELGLAYESCPGVSACFGAAASMNAEFTLPGVSQSLIITRVEGKTKVPALEQLELLASHQTTMAIYLSSTLAEEVEKRLMQGGYDADTPAAIVYKATWPEEQIYRCTVGTLSKTARENEIKSTAVILVGEVLAASGYERSRLYAADFETAYRGKRHEE